MSSAVAAASAASPVSTVANKRTKHSSGLHLDPAQAMDVPSGLKHETVIIPSTSQPSWGGYFTIDLREKPCIIRNLTLQFNTTTLTCTGTATSYPRFVPASYFFTRLELVVGGNVVDTIYGNQQFLINQIKYPDSQRISINNMMGNYACGAQRNTIATSANPSYYVNLETWVDQTKYLLLTSAHDVQIRAYVESLANVCDLSSNQTVPVSTLQSCNLIADITRLPPDIANSKIAEMAKSPYDMIFHDLRYGTFTVASGLTTTSLVMTPIVGKVACFFFTVRTSGTISNANAWNYTALSSFALLNSASTNIVGGQAISHTLATQYLNSNWLASSYTNENAIGSNETGVVQNNGANVYFWSFSSDIQSALKHGRCLGSFAFTGNEQLQLTFTSSLAAAVQVDVYALCESYLEQGTTFIKKVSM